MFFDGARLFVTKLQADKIMQLSSTTAKGINIDGDYYSFGSISKILTTEEYYKQFPKKVPVSYGEFPEMLPKVKLSITEHQQKRINRMEQMIKGISKYIRFNPSSKNAIKARESMQKKLDLIKSGDLSTNTQSQIDILINA